MKHPAPTRQPRETITFATVEAAILHLIESGKSPSEPNVRGLIGGSPNTLHPLMKRWFEERGPEFLAGRVSIVQSSDLPAAAHALIAELRDDARRAADAALQEAMEAAAAESAAARQAIADLETRERALAEKAAEVEKIIPTFKANLDMAQAELTAVRAASETAVRERREAIAAKEAAEAMALDAEKNARQLEEELGACEDTLASTRLEVDGAKSQIAKLEGRLAEAQAEITRASQESAATITSLRESIDEIKTAHLREVQGLRATHAEAASRWAEARANLERKVADAEGHADAAERARAAVAAKLSSTEQELAAAKAAIGASDAVAAELRARVADLEKIAARIPDGIAGMADLAERLQRLEGAMQASANGKE